MDHAQLVTLSRQTSILRQMDILANNVANTSTTGFKSRGLWFQEYLSGTIKGEARGSGSAHVSFVADQGATLDLSEGTIEKTGASMDIALRGMMLLAVKTPQGDRYTRNGALTLDRQGRLATADGHLVLGDGGPIQIDPADGPIAFTPDGQVMGKSGPLARLKLVDITDPTGLRNEGANLFSSAKPLPTAKDPRLIPGALEKSNVSPVIAMSQLIELNRAYAAVATSLQKLDDLRKGAIERLSSVPV